MNKEREEYVSLREEINQLCTGMDNIIGILYAFLAAYLAYVFDKEDTIYILFSYIIILPAYLLIVSKRIASCKISAYISVFHESGKNKWETRLIEYKTDKKLKIFNYIDAYHFPLIIADLVTFTLFIIKTNWTSPLDAYEIGKLGVETFLFISIIIIAVKSRKITVKDYLQSWTNIK